MVLAGLGKAWSPEEVSGRLAAEYPEDPELAVSSEAIYTWLSALPKGELKAELAAALRRGRDRRRPHSRATNATRVRSGA